MRTIVGMFRLTRGGGGSVGGGGAGASGVDGPIEPLGDPSGDHNDTPFLAELDMIGCSAKLPSSSAKSTSDNTNNGNSNSSSSNKGASPSNSSSSPGSAPVSNSSLSDGENQQQKQPAGQDEVSIRMRLVPLGKGFGDRIAETEPTFDGKHYITCYIDSIVIEASRAWVDALCIEHTQAFETWIESSQ